MLDKCKVAFKNDNGNKEKMNRYMDVLAIIQTIVLHHISEIDDKIAAWEKQFCINNDFALPINRDSEKSEEIKSFMDQIKYGKFMLQNAWHIKF